MSLSAPSPPMVRLSQRPINPYAEPAPSPAAVMTFGHSPTGTAAKGMTARVEKLMGFLGKDRIRELILEDLVGFGLLRTGLDFCRGYFYGTDEKLNLEAAEERIFREVMSIVTDIVISGVAAYGLGKALDARNGGVSQKFVEYTSLDAFKGVLADAQHKTGKSTMNEEGVAKALAKAIVGPEGSNHKAYATILKQVQSRQGHSDRAVTIAKALEMETLDRTIHTRWGKALHNPTLPLDKLLQNWDIIRQAVNKNLQGAATTSWQEGLLHTLKATSRNKNAQLACLSLGLVGTALVPPVTRWLTKQINGMDYYPAEKGFRTPEQERAEHQAQPGFWNKHFPYVTASLKKGNPLPLIGGLVPLIFATGVFNTVTRRFVNPFKPGFRTQLKYMLDFGKTFPFTNQQQIASLFAVLISSRVLFSRSQIEYRERAIDSGLGWMTWILGTPLLKLSLARMGNPALVKRVNGVQSLKTGTELSKLMPKGSARDKALGQHVWFGFGGLMFNLLMLGIVEPVASILWTRNQLLAKQKQERQAQANTQQNDPQALAEQRAKMVAQLDTLSPFTTLVPSTATEEPVVQPETALQMPAAWQVMRGGQFAPTQNTTPMMTPSAGPQAVSQVMLQNTLTTPAGGLTRRVVLPPMTQAMVQQQQMQQQQRA